jgi:hypothetical protein
MDATDWLIVATAAGPFIGALAATPITGAIRQLTAARRQRVLYVPASGADLYHNGVPLTEAQFRDVFTAYTSELAELPPPADRTEWDMKRQFAAAQRLAVLTGNHPHAFPNFGDPDQAWEWYAANNRHAAGTLPENPWTLRGLWRGDKIPQSVDPLRVD